MTLQEALNLNKERIAVDVSEQYIARCIDEGLIKVYSTIRIEKGVGICLSAILIQKMSAGKEYFSQLVPINKLEMENCLFGKIKD